MSQMLWNTKIWFFYDGDNRSQWAPGHYFSACGVTLIGGDRPYIDCRCTIYEKVAQTFQWYGNYDYEFDADTHSLRFIFGSSSMPPRNILNLQMAERRIREELEIMASHVGL